MTETEVVSIELAWPLRTQYGMVRIRVERTVPRSPPPGTPDQYDLLADDVATLVQREGERMEAKLRGK